MFRLRYLSLGWLFVCASVFAQQVPVEDSIRVSEFYRLAPAIEDKMWPEWSKTPAPLLLVTSETGEGFGKNYFEALQGDPDVVFAHAEVAKLLRGKKRD